MNYQYKISIQAIFSTSSSSQNFKWSYLSTFWVSVYLTNYEKHKRQI